VSAEVKQFALWGSAGHAVVLADVISLTGNRVVALFDNKDVASVLPGVLVYKGEIGFRHWAESRGSSIKGFAGLAAIGGGRGFDRIAIHKLYREYGLAVPVLIHPSAVVSQGALIGDGSQILALANVAAGVKLGEACIINHNASVDHECHLGDGVHLAPSATLCGCVTVGDNVFIGAGAIVLPRLNIGHGSTIGAGSVVTRDVPSGVTVVGNPAKSLN